MDAHGSRSVNSRDDQFMRTPLVGAWVVLVLGVAACTSADLEDGRSDRKPPVASSSGSAEPSDAPSIRPGPTSLASPTPGSKVAPPAGLGDQAPRTEVF